MNVRLGIAVGVVLLAVAVVAVLTTKWQSGGPIDDPAHRAAQPTSEVSPQRPPEFAPPPSIPPVAPPAETAETKMVEVQGAVVAPGVYTLQADARLFDALTSAGGVTEDSDTTDLNIAARLIDGSVITVPYRALQAGDGTPGAVELNPPAYTRVGWQGSGTGGGDSGDRAVSGTGLVNLNTASQDALESLPGVGPKTAEKIIRFRSIQPFTSVDDLRYVQGIGEKRLESLRPLVSVE